MNDLFFPRHLLTSEISQLDKYYTVQWHNITLNTLKSEIYTVQWHIYKSYKVESQKYSLIWTFTFRGLVVDDYDGALVGTGLHVFVNDRPTPSRYLPGVMGLGCRLHRCQTTVERFHLRAQHFTTRTFAAVVWRCTCSPRRGSISKSLHRDLFPQLHCTQLLADYRVLNFETSFIYTIQIPDTSTGHAFQFKKLLSIPILISGLWDIWNETTVKTCCESNFKWYLNSLRYLKNKFLLYYHGLLRKFGQLSQYT